MVEMKNTQSENYIESPFIHFLTHCMSQREQAKDGLRPQHNPVYVRKKGASKKNDSVGLP